MKKKFIASYCADCQRVGVSYQTPFIQFEDGRPVCELQLTSESERAVYCPHCGSEIGHDSGGAWNEVEYPPVSPQGVEFRAVLDGGEKVYCPDCGYGAIVPKHPRISRTKEVHHVEVGPENPPVLMLRCASCRTSLAVWSNGMWAALEAGPVFEREPKPRTAPFQRVVNHAPEHARRIASLEEQIKELREFLGMNLVNSVSDRLKKELKVEERLEAVEALMTEWEWESCANEVTELKKRVEKVETEGVGYKAVVTRDPELQNQFTKLEKKIEPLQGWMNEVAEKFKKLEGWRADARVNMLEGEIGGAAEERAELASRVTGIERQLDLYQERLGRLQKSFADRNNRNMGLKERVEQLANKLPMKGAAAATDHVNAVAQEVRKLSQQAVEFEKQLDKLRTDVMGDDTLTNDGSLLSRVDGLNQRICRIEEKKTSVPMSVLADLRVLKERVEDLAKTPDLETELSQHLKQSDSGYEELQRRISHLEPRVGKLEEHKLLFNHQKDRIDGIDHHYGIRLTELERQMRNDRTGSMERDRSIHEGLSSHHRRDKRSLEQLRDDFTTLASRVTGIETQLGDLARRDDGHTDMIEGFTEGTVKRFEDIEKKLDETAEKLQQLIASATRALLIGDAGPELKKDLGMAKRDIERLERKLDSVGHSIPTEWANRIEQLELNVNRLGIGYQASGAAHEEMRKLYQETKDRCEKGRSNGGELANKLRQLDNEMDWARSQISAMHNWQLRYEATSNQTDHDIRSLEQQHSRLVDRLHLLENPKTEDEGEDDGRSGEALPSS